MNFKLYTTTKFRIYKNRGGRFIPEYKTFTELGTTVNRARRSDAQKFIQRKAARLFYGEATIEYVEASATLELSRGMERAATANRLRLATLNYKLSDPCLAKGGEGEQIMLDQRAKLLGWFASWNIPAEV